jgi:hypothetical protein
MKKLTVSQAARMSAREWLSPAQRDQFDRRGYFEVIGSQALKFLRIFLH